MDRRKMADIRGATTATGRVLATSTTVRTWPRGVYAATTLSSPASADHATATPLPTVTGQS